MMTIYAVFPKKGKFPRTVVESCMTVEFAEKELSTEQQLTNASKIFYGDLDVIPTNLLEWAEQSGLSRGKDELRKVLAQQAALEALLIAVLESLPVADKVHFELDGASTQLFTDLKSYTEVQASFAGNAAAIVAELRRALPRDVLGTLYEKLTPQAARRMLGQHWTPSPIVELMTAWAARAGTRILEPAVGSGRFVQAFERHCNDSDCYDSAASPYLRAYEVSPLVLLLAQVNAALAKPAGAELDFRLEDFLKSEAKADFDAVICNPPYTRHHLISDEMKAFLTKRELEKFNVKMSGFTSLFVYFFVHAISHVRSGGRLAFITPSELYEASYSTSLKRILKAHAVPDAIITFDKATQVFENVDTAGCITLATRDGGVKATALVQVQEWPGTKVILEAIEAGIDQQTEWGRVMFVEVETLTPASKWSNVDQMSAQASALPPLSSVAKIMRGIATGANSYFCLSDKEVETYGIPRKFLSPVATKTRTIKNYKFNPEDFETLRREGREVWLFSHAGSLDEAPKEVSSYIERGRQLEVHERSLLKKKKHWYAAERRDPPPILFTYLSRGRTRFIYNAAGVQALNVFLLIYPKPEIANDPSRIKALVAILNSSAVTRSLHAAGRSYGGDTVKLEPREMDKVPILDPMLLGIEELDRLTYLFDRLCEEPKSLDRKADLDREVQRSILKYEGAVPIAGRNEQGSLFV